MTAPVTYTREQMVNAVTREADYHRQYMPNGEQELTLRAAAATLRQAAAEGQGNERLQAQVAELEVWNDAALKREDELRVQCASLSERVVELEARVAKRVDLTTEVQA